MKKSAPVIVQVLKTDGILFKIKFSYLKVPITVNKDYFDNLVKDPKDFKII